MKIRLQDDTKENYRVLLLASYCDRNFNMKCTDEFPCDECLKMCNVANVNSKGIEVLGGLDYLKFLDKRYK